MTLNVRNTNIRNYQVDTYLEALESILGPNIVYFEAIEGDEDYNVSLDCEGNFSGCYKFPTEALSSSEAMAEYFIKNELIKDKFYRNNLSLKD